MQHLQNVHILYSQIEWGTCCEAEKSLLAGTSFDIAVESLHLRFSELTMSVGFMRPFGQVWACDRVGSCRAAGSGAVAAAGCTSRCFLGVLSAQCHPRISSP